MLRLLAYLFDLIVVVIIGRILSRLVGHLFGAPQAGSGGPRGAARPGPNATRAGQTARDPVCGMFVSTELSHRLTRGSETLHFCSQECLERYQKSAAG